MRLPRHLSRGSSPQPHPTHQIQIVRAPYGAELLPVSHLCHGLSEAPPAHGPASQPKSVEAYLELIWVYF